MQCSDSLRVQAYFDGEADAVTAADIERHMERCAECRTLHRDLDELRTALRRDLPHTPIPPALRARVMRALDEESSIDSPQRRPRPTWRTRPFWMGATSGGFGMAAVAATLAFLLVSPQLTDPRDRRGVECPCEFVTVDAFDRRRLHGQAYREAVVCRSHRCFTARRRLRATGLTSSSAAVSIIWNINAPP
jgi:hypothetical protein